MAKDKKKKKDKKGAKADRSKSGGSPKITDSIKALSQNPVLADIVAAALVATASALKDSRRARQLASEAGDELMKLSKSGAEKGNAMWDMALQIGRRSLEALSSEESPKRPKAKATGKKPARKKPAPGRNGR